MIDARAIARALGGDVVAHNTIAAPGPGHSRKDRSLTIKLDPGAPDGFVVFSHAGDDWRDCRDHVREQLGWPRWQPGNGRDRRVDPSRVRAFDRAVVEAEAGPRERTADELARIERAVAIWNAAVDPRGTVAERYLRSRALTLDEGVAGSVLRYHPQCFWRDENSGQTIHVPALVAAFRSVDDGAITAVQRVALTADGRKVGRRMLGVVRRGAVKLDRADGTLSVGEGVETALAARVLGHRPAWALGSVGMIAQFPVLDGVRQLSILGETGEASAAAIKLCGQRWHAAGRKVRVIMPSVGDDLNSELMMAAS